MVTQVNRVKAPPESERFGQVPLGLAGDQFQEPTRSEFAEIVPQAFMACQDNIEFMRDLPDGSMKLIVTSPPYNIGKSYERRSPMEDYLQDQERVIEECVRLLHPSGSLCWQVGNYVENGEVVPLDVMLYPLFKRRGLKMRNRIVWHFGHGLHSSKRLSGRYETINWFTKSDDYTFNLDPIRVPSKYPNKRHFKGPNIGKLSGNPKGKNPSDVWMFPNVKSNHVEKTIHPMPVSGGTCRAAGALHDRSGRFGSGSVYGGRHLGHRRADARTRRIRLRCSGGIRRNRVGESSRR